MDNITYAIKLAEQLQKDIDKWKQERDAAMDGIISSLKALQQTLEDYAFPQYPDSFTSEEQQETEETNYKRY